MAKEGRQIGFRFINNYMQTRNLALQIPRAGVTTGFVPQIFGQDDEWRRNKEHYVGQLPHNLPYWLVRVARASLGSGRCRARRSYFLKCELYTMSLFSLFFFFTFFLFSLVYNFHSSSCNILLWWFCLLHYNLFLRFYFLVSFVTNFRCHTLFIIHSCNHGLRLTAYLRMCILHLYILFSASSSLFFSFSNLNLSLL